MMQQQQQPHPSPPTNPPRKRRWYNDPDLFWQGFIRSNYVTAFTDWFMGLAGKLAEVVLYVTVLYSGAELYPGVTCTFFSADADKNVQVQVAALQKRAALHAERSLHAENQMQIVSLQIRQKASSVPVLRSAGKRVIRCKPDRGVGRFPREPTYTKASGPHPREDEDHQSQGGTARLNTRMPPKGV